VKIQPSAFHPAKIGKRPDARTTLAHPILAQHKKATNLSSSKRPSPRHSPPTPPHHTSIQLLQHLRAERILLVIFLSGLSSSELSLQAT
jgi:hypothetical protein